VKPIQPHDLRHAFVTLSLEAGASSSDMQDSARNGEGQMSQGPKKRDLDRWTRKNREPITDDFKAGLVLAMALEGLIWMPFLFFFSLNTVEYYLVGAIAGIPFLVWLHLWWKRPPES